jgi:hypothetical protein
VLIEVYFPSKHYNVTYRDWYLLESGPSGASETGLAANHLLIDHRAIMVVRIVIIGLPLFNRGFFMGITSSNRGLTLKDSVVLACVVA